MRVTFVKSARKDVPGSDIKAGESYWWWKFRFGPKRVSRTQPKRSQLTQSSFLSQLYDLQDDVIANAQANEDLEGVIEETKGTLEQLRDECQDSLDNIPDQLKEGNSGSILQERIEALEQAIDELDSIDTSDPPTEDDLDDADRLEDETDDEWFQRRDERLEEMVNDYWNEKLEEFQNVEVNA